MTIFISVIREGGAETLMPLRQLLKQVPFDDLPEVSSLLGGKETAVTLKLMNGETVELRMAEADRGNDPEKQAEMPFDGPYTIPARREIQYPVQALRPPEPHLRHARVNLHFTLSCEIHEIPAVSDEQAVEIIKEIARGDHSPLNAGAKVYFDPEETKEFLRGLQAMLETGDLSQVAFADVVPTGFFQPDEMIEPSPTRELTYQELP